MYADLAPHRLVHAVEPLQHHLIAMNSKYGDRENIIPMHGALGSKDHTVRVHGVKGMLRGIDKAATVNAEPRTKR